MRKALSADRHVVQRGRSYWLITESYNKGGGVHRVRVTGLEGSGNYSPIARLNIMNSKVYSLGVGDWFLSVSANTLFHSEEAAIRAVEKAGEDEIADFEVRIKATKKKLSFQRGRFTSEKKRTA